MDIFDENNNVCYGLYHSKCKGTMDININCLLYLLFNFLAEAYGNLKQDKQHNPSSLPGTTMRHVDYIIIIFDSKVNNLSMSRASPLLRVYKDYHYYPAKDLIKIMMKRSGSKEQHNVPLTK